MRRKGMLRYLLWLVGGVIALFAAAVLIVSLIRIPIDVSGYKGLVESAASDALGRSVTVDGGITVTTSLWPYFEIGGIRIANPEGFGAGDLAKMDRAHIRVGLWPLIERQVRVETFRIEGLSLNLVRNERGAVNWVFGGPAGTAPTQAEAATSDGPPPGFSADALAVDEFVLENISATYRDRSDEEELNFVMDRAVGSAAHGEPMSLEVNGELLDEPFTLRIEANSIGEFLTLTHSRLQVEVAIAETRFRFAGSSDALGGQRTTELDVQIDGERLDSLDELLRLDLPPLRDYRLRAHLAASPGRLELSELEVSVRDNTLNGSMIVDETGTRPFAKVELTAGTIQLADLDMGGWSPDAAGSEPPKAASTGGGTGPEVARPRAEAKLLSPEALQRVDLELEVRVAEVLSGDDLLGSGELVLELKDGRLSLDPLRLRSPDSSLLLMASVKPGTSASDASLRVLIEDFDVGALLRLKEPDSDIGGTLNMDIDVTASAGDVRSLLTGANGYLDVAGPLENFRAGIIDLWAVNLLSSVVAASAEDDDISTINCIISRWSLHNGTMTAENLAIDTSKIRICGEGSIDFNEQTFDLMVSPVAKRPEFFSLATPLTVDGSFEDFRIGTRAGILSLGTTAVKFAISPITTPVERLIREDLPEDGGDICALPIGPREVELQELPGC